MKMMQLHIFVALLLTIFLFVPQAVFAHLVWINAVDYTPTFHERFSAGTKIYFGYGHKYPVHDFIKAERLTEFICTDPENKKRDLKPGPGGFLATHIKFKKPGSHLISAIVEPGFYTIYTDKGKVRHNKGPMTGLEGIISSLYYERYAKALINVGETDDTFFLTPIGHRVEIIPMQNPAKLKAGDFLDLKVLFKDKPARYFQVYATYSGFSTDNDFAYTTGTDAKGMARIRILHYGQWLIKADIKMPAPDKLKATCRQVHYTATLTFGIE
jgi:uncharacterized GH25 family protein